MGRSAKVVGRRIKWATQGADDSLMAEHRSSRRRFLGAMVGAACVCRLAVSASPLAHASNDGSVARLDQPGTALQPAERLALRVPPIPEGKLMFPVSAGSDCYVLDNFGDARGSTRLHEGVDIMGSAGRPVVAVASGVLTKRYTNTGTAGWGWTLYDESTDTSYKYFHLAEDAAGLREGRVGVGRAATRIRRQQRHVRREQLPPALRGATAERGHQSVAAAGRRPRRLSRVAADPRLIVSAGCGRAG